MIKRIQNGIDELKKISMTTEEKSRVLGKILNYQDKKPVLSPWQISIKKIQFVTAVIIIVIFSGSGIVFASKESLPDSILYPIKTNVIEPIEGALAFTPERKALHESKLATRRLIEAEKMAGKNKLDEPTTEKLNNLLLKHTDSMNRNLMHVTETKKSHVEEIVNNFDQEMNKHAERLEKIDRNEHKISNTARNSAGNLKNIYKKPDSGDNHINRESNYIKKNPKVENGKNNKDKSDKDTFEEPEED